MEPTVLSLASLEIAELEAFVELMFLAAFADGAVTDDERAAFRGQVVEGTHGQLDAAMIDTVLVHIERGLTAHGDREAHLATIKDRLGDARKRHAALVHAARVVLADGVLRLDEVAFLRRATVALGEPVETVDAVLREARAFSS
jgi:uncharacterized tellurite resistance protein B-like protein